MEEKVGRVGTGRQGGCCKMLSAGHDMNLSLTCGIIAAIVTCTSQPNARIDGLEDL